ncbi:hypothetical protein ACWKNT_001050 [Enterobacter sichuanensis]
MLLKVPESVSDKNKRIKPKKQTNLKIQKKAVSGALIRTPTPKKNKLHDLIAPA